jgi:glycosyltransferase involved in cell wall biosynthesis
LTAAALEVALDASAVPARPAGAGRYVVELVAALGTRTDVAVTVLARRGDRDRWRAAASVRDAAPGRRPVRLLWEQVRLPRLLAGLPVRVHHGPHYTMPQRARLPRLVTVHDCTVFDHPEWHERSKVWLFRRAMRAAARRAAGIICVSAATAARYEVLCSPRVPLHVIPHGVDHERFRPAGPGSDADDLARLAAAGVRPPFVGFVGTIEPRKDVPSLVRAFDRIAGARADLRLVIAGGPGWGSAGADLERAVAEARHGDRVVRTGYVPDDLVAPLLRQAVAVAYPSLAEGFGLPALEALACGAPLVTTAGTAMAEVAGDAALLVEPGDVTGLAAALDALAAGDPGQAARRRSGLERAGRHTWKASADAHVVAYREAAGP